MSTFTNENWGDVKCTLDGNGLLTINTEKKDVVIDTKPDVFDYIVVPWNMYRSRVNSVNILGHISFTKGNSLKRLFSDCYNCKSINGLKNLDVTEVVDMDYMFYGCKALTSIQLSNWNCENLNYMGQMFNGCTGLISLDLTNFKLNSTKYVDMTDTFNNCSNLTYIITPGSFDLRNLFQTKIYSNYPNLSSLDGTKVNSADQIKPNTLYFTKPLRWSNSLTNSCYWSYDKYSSTLTIKSDGTNNKANSAIELKSQFTLNNNTVIVNISEVKQVKIEGSIKFVEGTDLTKLFYNFSNCESFDGLGNLDVTEVVDMSFMFSNCLGLTNFNVPNWNVAKVTNMSSMFNGCGGLKSLDLSSFKFKSNITIDVTDMFNNCSSLTSIVTPSSFDSSDSFQKELYSKYPNLNEIGVKVNSSTKIKPNTLYFTKPLRWSNSLTNSCYWSYDKNNSTLTIYSDGTNNKANNASELKNNFTTTNGIKLVEPSKVKQVKIEGSIKFIEGTDLTKLFYNCYNCKSINGLKNLDVTEVVDMNIMFAYCSSLSTLDLSNWNVAKVSNFNQMFYSCKGLTSIITPKEFNTKGKFTKEFYTYFSTWYDIYGNQPTSKDDVKTTMIYRKNENVDVDSLPKWWNEAEDSCYWNIVDTTLTIFSMKNHSVGYNASDLREQIQNYVSIITEVNIIGPTITFKNSSDSTELANLSGLFANFVVCESINGLENFDVTNVGYMTSMFFMPYTEYTNKLQTLDISNWNTSNVTNMASIFGGCNGLTELDVSNWNTSNVTNIASMFSDCSQLKELNLNSFNLKNITSENGITNMFYNLNNLETIITPYQFDSSGLFQQEFKSSLIYKPNSEDSTNNQLRDIGNLQLITKASDVRPGYVYTRKNTKVASETYKLSSNIVGILN